MVDNIAGPSTVKHRQGKPLKSGKKNVILNVFDNLLHEHKYPSLPIKQIMQLTSDFMGASALSISSTRKGRQETGT
jgi:hypothetical protein